MTSDELQRRAQELRPGPKKCDGCGKPIPPGMEQRSLEPNPTSNPVFDVLCPECAKNRNTAA
jgi:hypothetical protein